MSSPITFPLPPLVSVAETFDDRPGRIVDSMDNNELTDDRVKMYLMSYVAAWRHRLPWERMDPVLRRRLVIDQDIELVPIEEKQVGLPPAN